MIRYFYSINQKIIEYQLGLQLSLGRILMFHQVSDMKKNILPGIYITYISFKKLMDKLLNLGHEIISLSDIKKKINLSDTSIALTFDDGYSDLYKYVAEYLFSKNVPFTIFATTGLLNKTDYLTNEQLKDFSNNPLCTIGSHTVNHPILSQINNIESMQEIKNSKCTLEDIISKEIEYFAYPYGSHYAVSKRDIENVKKSGYSLAFGTINSFLSEKALKNKWFLPRINVSEQTFQRIE